MQNRNLIPMDDDRIGRLLFKLTLPAFVGMLVMTLYNVIDTIFIGRYVGPLGIAGLSIVFPLQMLMMGVGQMMGMGGASLVSRLIGAKNEKRAELALGNALSIVVILSLILMGAGLANADFWLKLLGSSDTILPYARDYLTIILGGMIFHTVSMASHTLIRAEGNARVAMIGMIIGAVVNIALDALFIVVLDMGIKGAALATTLAHIFATAYLLFYYLSGRSYLKIRVKNLIPDFNILKEILAIGVASLAMTLANSLSAILVNRLLGSYGGDFAISAFGIVNRIMMFAIMPGIVIGQGLQPILGYNYGAKRFDRALRSIRLALTTSTGLCLAAFLALFFAAEPIIGIFTTDAELIALGSEAARRVFLLLYLIGFIFVGGLIFQSIGKPIQSFITAISRSVLFLIPSLLILPRFFQLEGVWLSFPVSDALTFLLTLALLIPQIRSFRRMNAESQLSPADTSLH